MARKHISVVITFIREPPRPLCFRHYFAYGVPCQYGHWVGQGLADYCTLWGKKSRSQWEVSLTECVLKC